MKHDSIHDLVIRGAQLVDSAGRLTSADIAVHKGRITAVGDVKGEATTTIDARGLVALPGVIDPQVHFREPGGEHKEDLATGTLAAIAGGVTCVLEMPNTNPTTTTAERLADKVHRANGRASCDIGFYVGASPDNVTKLPELETLEAAIGVKVFMGSSTGDLLVSDDDTVLSVLQHAQGLVAVHSEDENRLEERKSIAVKSGDIHDHPVWRDAECARLCTERLLRLADKANRKVHVLHVTTVDEMELLARHRHLATVETSPQHLTMEAPECYDRLGTYAQMNPPIRDRRHREGLWKAVRDGVVDVIGSDHAPHTHEEKAKSYPQSPSGMPGVQTLLPILLHHRHHGRLDWSRLVDLTSRNTTRIFRLANKGQLAPGFDGDITLVDPDHEWTITNDWIKSRCGWTPFDGFRATGKAMATIVRGNVVMREDEIIGDPIGRPVRVER